MAGWPQTNAKTIFSVSTPANRPPPPSAAAPAAPTATFATSVALQREAAMKQAQSVGARLIPWTPMAPSPPECDRLADDILAPLIESAAKHEQLDGKLIRAVIEQESAMRPCAVSPRGAQGLMQLMPDTAAQLSVADVFDPGQNIDAGARYLKQLLEKYKGNISQALAAYNAGPGEVDKAGGIPNIAETKDYVDAILRKVSINPAGTAAPQPPSGDSTSKNK